MQFSGIDQLSIGTLNGLFCSLPSQRMPILPVKHFKKCFTIFESLDGFSVIIEYCKTPNSREKSQVILIMDTAFSISKKRVYKQTK